MSIASFQEAAQRLIALAKQSVQAGDTSERRLARTVGFSQPHLHNILAGKRGLTPRGADRLLEGLGLTLPGLLGGQAPLKPAGVPCFEGPLGGGRPAPRQRKDLFVPFFEPRLLPKTGSAYLGRVAQGERAMAPALRPGDAVLVDCGHAARRRPNGFSIYLLEWEGAGYLCRCRLSADALITLTDSSAPVMPPPSIPLKEARPEDFVRGMVVWYGRAMTRITPAPFDG